MTRTGRWTALAGLLVLASCDEAMMAETAEPDSGLPSPARAACMSAVATAARDGYVTVESATPTGAGTEMIVGVGETEKTPWRCTAAEDGAVLEVTEITGQAPA